MPLQGPPGVFSNGIPPNQGPEGPRRIWTRWIAFDSGIDQDTLETAQDVLAEEWEHRRD